MWLLAFAAERRLCSNRLISPSRLAHSSKPIAAAKWWHGQTFGSFTDPTSHPMWAVSTNNELTGSGKVVGQQIPRLAQSHYELTVNWPGSSNNILIFLSIAAKQWTTLMFIREYNLTAKFPPFWWCAQSTRYGLTNTAYRQLRQL